jgi:hypothetical protein
MNHLREALSQYWLNIQGSLFAWLKEELGELTDKQRQLVTTLEFLRLEEHLPSSRGFPGRPPKDRAAIARAFVAKMVYDMPTTRVLLDRLSSDITLRRICGWERQTDIPHESAFSRAFAEFAASELAGRTHEALIERTQGEHLIGHLSRDSTQINAREKPLKKPKEKANATPRKPGRPKKGEERQKVPTRLERQTDMSLEEMLEDLPTSCDVGTKKNSKGSKQSWVGYKLHIDAADGAIPISCILTSASVHDSQVAIPLAATSAQRVTNLYDLMDSAYDVEQIREYSQNLSHVPIIDINPRRDKALKEELEAEAKRLRLINHTRPEEVRYNERSTVERVNGRLKDEFGARRVRVRGHAKVMAHLMFGILALTVDQLMRFIE